MIPSSTHPWRAKRRGSLGPSAATISRPGGREALVVSVLLPLTTFSILCYEIVLTRLFAYVFTFHVGSPGTELEFAL